MSNQTTTESQVLSPRNPWEKYNSDKKKKPEILSSPSFQPKNRNDEPYIPTTEFIFPKSPDSILQFECQLFHFDV